MHTVPPGRGAKAKPGNSMCSLDSSERCVSRPRLGHHRDPDAQEKLVGRGILGDARDEKHEKQKKENGWDLEDRAAMSWAKQMSKRLQNLLRHTAPKRS